MFLLSLHTGFSTNSARVSTPRLASSIRPARVAKIGLAYDIYADVPDVETKFTGTADEALEAIFLSHREGTVLKPGTPMYAACQDLATSYPALGGLSDDALVGRLFQFLDEDGDGVLEVDEWVPGVSAVLNKKTPKATALADRIAQGNAPVQQPNDFSKARSLATTRSACGSRVRATGAGQEDRDHRRRRCGTAGGQRAAQGGLRGQDLREEQRRVRGVVRRPEALEPPTHARSAPLTFGPRAPGQARQLRGLRSAGPPGGTAAGS